MPLTSERYICVSSYGELPYRVVNTRKAPCLVSLLIPQALHSFWHMIGAQCSLHWIELTLTKTQENLLLGSTVLGSLTRTVLFGSFPIMMNTWSYLANKDAAANADFFLLSLLSLAKLEPEQPTRVPATITITHFSSQHWPWPRSKVSMVTGKRSVFASQQSLLWSLSEAVGNR